jgi:hypothetical protein
VAATAHGDEQIIFAREINALNHIARSEAAGNEGGAFVNRAIPNFASLVIARFARAEQWAAQTGFEILDCRLVDHSGLPKGR